MAQTEASPDNSQESSVLERMLGTSDHKTIGRMWMVCGALLLLVGTAISGVAAVEQISLGGFSIAQDADELVQIWSAGRALTLFGGIIALLVGLGTYLVPLQVGSSAIAFGRGANAAFWVWMIAIDLMAVSYLLNGGPGGGRRDFVVLWILSFGAALLGIMWALICIATTVLAARAPGMTLENTPISAWAFALWAIMGLAVLPITLGHLALAYLDYGYSYMSDYVQLAHIITGFSLAPAIYWLAIPALGLAAEIVGVHSGKPIRFHRSVLVALGAVALTAFAADIFGFAGSSRTLNEAGEVGFRQFPFDNALLVVTLFCAVPPLLAVLGLIGDSLKNGQMKINAPMLGALVGGALIVAGAVVALIANIDPIVGFFADLANRYNETPDALRVNGTTFNAGITALVIGGATVAAIGGLHHWAHKIWGRHLSNGMGSIAVAAVAAGSAAAAVGNIGAGLRGQSALPAIDSSFASGVEALNALVAIGALLAIAGLGALVLDLVRTAMSSRTDTAQWTGHTLEWMTASPPPVTNFDAPPSVSSPFPLLDMAETETPELEEVVA